MILCDTNILVELYKNNPTVINEMRKIGMNQIAISIITQAELYYGAINKVEFARIQKHLNLINKIPIDEQISAQFIQLMGRYSLSHKLAIPDALIAATALVYDMSLYTLNLKDFRFIEGLNLYVSPS
ncbi:MULTISPECIES: type II toxin-antitoxin system VapC family toxin [Planktothricoides]|uniref:Type II toxin-antitoxin system VapC family toxin n=1 Tax=Planktothricoides raciborskii FACHB-1370 TaxID=2949576 RepID=A0ABR8ENB1_9CYAN|nr:MULTISPECIES: type II toxin-antitoxin system VapC family toxin [Planktothricoides]KOR38580.1 pilus assembly protein [Planktothricoides sp. SR001]MBD2547574.1 type II toxin-antitoxin system VapC family toxin [Planktothricoides raciborskii FACHB-1370]MBD2586050.1 type II toxin-antitoxin system VapC family toxin [Planktothricoides raciborskii FACHB-1261]